MCSNACRKGRELVLDALDEFSRENGTSCWAVIVDRGDNQLKSSSSFLWTSQNQRRFHGLG